MQAVPPAILIHPRQDLRIPKEKSSVVPVISDKRQSTMRAIRRIFGKGQDLLPSCGFDPEIRQLEDPDHVVLPLDYPGQIHYLPVVKAGEVVRKGQIVARSRIGNAVIASISGKVREIATVWTAQSVHSPAVVIDNDGGEALAAEEIFDGPVPAGKFDAALQRMRSAGVASPWSLSGREWQIGGELPELPKINTVIVTGVRQEVTVVTTELLLDQQREKTAEGLRRIAALFPGARLCLTAPERFREWADDHFGKVAERYYLPQDYRARIEREIVADILGHRIPNRDAYRFHGVLVIDLEYLLATLEALNGCTPLTQKFLTISGHGIDPAVTVRFPMGSSLSFILASQGLDMADYTRVVVGGPMMGVAQYNDNTPITYYNGIHLITGEVAPFDNIAPCISCGRCTRACPADIQVHLVNRMVEFGQLELARQQSPEACHECGLCAYVCPAQRPIVQLLHFCNRDMVHGERVNWAEGGLS
jgi:electron transport complex protein RnfC